MKKVVFSGLSVCLFVCPLDYTKSSEQILMILYFWRAGVDQEPCDLILVEVDITVWMQEFFNRYEGRSISKLQNSIILIIFKV